MYLLKVIGISILILISSAHLCYGQPYYAELRMSDEELREVADKLLKKGNAYGSQGDFKKARELINQARDLASYKYRRTDLSYSATISSDLQASIEILDYVEQQKINPSLAIKYFKTICDYSSSQKHWEEIISQNYNSVIKLNPSDTYAYLIRGYIYEYIYDDLNRSTRIERHEAYDNAIDDFSRAIDLSPEFVDAYLKRGSLWLNKHRDKKEADYNKAIELKPAFSDAYLRRGRFYHSYEPDKAIEDYNKAIELDPENPEPYFYRGRIYFGKKEYDNALADFNKVIELNRDASSAYGNRSEIYLIKGLYNNAISDFNIRLVILRKKYPNDGLKDPFRWSPWNEDRNAQRIDKMFSSWRKAKDIVLNNADEYFTRGHIYYSLHQYDYAISDFNRAIELNPKYLLYYNNRGSAYVKLGKFKEAISDYTKAIELNPEDAHNFYLRGKTYFHNKQYAYAISDFSDATELETEPEYVHDIYNSRGDVYDKIGLYDKAIADYKKGGSKEKLADIYSKASKYKEAITEYTKIITNNPNYTRFYIKRGDAYDEIEDLENACSDWKKARDLGDPSRWSIINRIRCLGK